MPAVGEAEARASAERIRSQVSQLSIPGLGPGQRPIVTISIGVAVFYPARSDATPVALIAAADEALLIAKRTGRNRVVVSERAAYRHRSAG
jgi:diguanylate cyclase (GGDEF)-like protein